MVPQFLEQHTPAYCSIIVQWMVYGSKLKQWCWGKWREEIFKKKKKPTKQWKCYLDISHVMAVINS